MKILSLIDYNRKTITNFDNIFVINIEPTNNNLTKIHNILLSQFDIQDFVLMCFSKTFMGEIGSIGILSFDDSRFECIQMNNMDVHIIEQLYSIKSQEHTTNNGILIKFRIDEQLSLSKLLLKM